MKKTKIFIKTILMVITIFIANNYCSYIELFQVEEIIIEGNKYTNKQNFLSKIDDFKLENLFKVDLDRLDKLFESNKYVDDIDVGILLPSTIVIQVYEFQPVYFLQIGEDYSFIDKNDKVIVGSKEANQIYKSPKIYFSSSVKDNDQRKLFKLVKQSLVEVFENYNQIYAEIKHIIIYDELMVIKSKHKTKITLYNSEISRKFNHLSQLITKDKKSINEYEYIDLTKQNKIIVKNREINKWAAKR